MQSYSALWWIAARHWAQISTLSPVVISERVLASAAAGARPSAGHQAEMTRMVTEKSEAVVESATAFWLAAAHGQQLAWQRAWKAGRPAPGPADYALAESTARKFGNAWSPLSRRVSANAKRLSARKRKSR